MLIYKYLKTCIHKWYRDLALVKKINLSGFFVILLPMVVLALLSGRVSSKILVDKAIATSLHNLKQTSLSLDGLISYTEQLADIIITNSDIQSFASENNYMSEEDIFRSEMYLSVVLDSIINPENKVESAVLYFPDEIVIPTALVNKTKLRNEFETGQLRCESKINLMKNEEWMDLHFVGYLEDIAVANVISFKKNIIDGRTGRKAGTVVISIREEALYNSYKSQSEESSDRFLILNKSGTIISGRNKDSLYESLDNDEVYSIIQDQYNAAEIIRIHGTSYLVTSLFYDRMGWYITGLVPLKDIVKDNRSVIFLIYMTGIICFFLAMGSSVITSRNILKPLNQLSHVMSDIGMGKLSARAENYGNDEIGNLAVRFNEMANDIEQLMSQVHEEHRKLREFEFIAMQSQINPHFLYNTLESVCSLSQLKRHEDTFRLAKALSNFYRTSLSHGSSIISLEEELKNIESYMIIQKIRYGEKLEYEIDMEPGILDNSIPKLSIQPLVENSIYHGIREKRGSGLIGIKGYKTDKGLCIQVSDNGIGMRIPVPDFCNESAQQSSVSFGINSIHERIVLLYGASYGLEIESNAGAGTVVRINLPRTILEENLSDA